MAVVACSVAAAPLAGCGGSSSDEDGTSPAELVTTTQPADTEPAPSSTNPAATDQPAPTTGPATTTAPTSAPVPGDPTPTTPEPGSAGPVDPTLLDPRTALVVIDGAEYRFVAGSSMFDVCQTFPDEGIADVELDLVDGPEGGPHLVLTVGSVGDALVVAYRPDTGFVAGEGERVVPYVDAFGIDPPALGSIEIGQDVVSGSTQMVDVFNGAVVEAAFGARCR